MQSTITIINACWLHGMHEDESEDGAAAAIHRAAAASGQPRARGYAYIYARSASLHAKRLLLGIPTTACNRVAQPQLGVIKSFFPRDAICGMETELAGQPLPRRRLAALQARSYVCVPSPSSSFAATMCRSLGGNETTVHNCSHV